ncbi:TetR/AcrR family transcriptional regulator [Allonocardiopsis opalescens]|uniref:TetR family transcriptional regulator n=1 Tax=Allonocardiopsis opalescens TaxID=1144618 RepID=A0A2T0Q0T4_9ACTN|nr:TetR/AcrR family transcriptional regulator [Allonocardiopsis opalescens]PRX97398.1 TetR family transcriptional regulator [Allonocardiopsis opalescens]
MARIARGGTPAGRRAGGSTVPDRLLAAASRLFAQRGFESTSVQDVVEAAGVTKGAMYHYFRSKDDLLHEIYRRLLTMQTQRLADFAAAEGPLPERLFAAASDVVQTSIANLDDSVIFFRSMHLLTNEHQTRVRAERRRYHELFRSLIEEGQRSGAFRDDIPAGIVTIHYFGSVHQLGTWYRPDGKMTPRELGEYYATLLLAGLRPEPGAAGTAGRESDGA